MRDGTGVEIRDVRVVLRDPGHSIAFHSNGGHDRLSGLTCIFAESASELHHARDRSTGDLRCLLITHFSRHQTVSYKEYTPKCASHSNLGLLARGDCTAINAPKSRAAV